MEAFSVGIMGKRQLSKREIEEQKKKEDEEAAAHVRSPIIVAINIITNNLNKKILILGFSRICGNLSANTESIL